MIRPRNVTTFSFAARRIHIEQLLAQWSHGIVYGSHLGRVDAVFVDYRGAGEITYRDYVVGVEHTVALDVEHGRVHIAARAVEVGGVHVDYHRLAGHLLGMYACGICEPVVEWITSNSSVRAMTPAHIE